MYSKDQHALAASDDNIETVWRSNLLIELLSNDVYSSAPQIVITSSPQFGKLLINDKTVEYIPNQPIETIDTFEYQLIIGNYSSNNAKVTIKLNNAISELQILEGDYIEDNQTINLRITTTIPVKENTIFAIERLVNQTSNFPIQHLTMEKGKTSVVLTSIITSNENAQYDSAQIFKVYSETNENLHGEISFNYLAVAKPENMFLSIKPNWYNKNSADLMVKERGLYMNWMNYPVWQIPENPAWSENPFNNNSWLLYYHSLYWLFAYEYAYDESQNEQYLALIGNTILNYLKNSPRDTPKSHMSWDDHTVSLRTDVISYFYNKYFKYIWNVTEKNQFFNSLDIHADELRKLLDNPVFKANNHAMFHALSLYNLTYAFPLRTINTDYRTRAIERIYELFEELIDTETGISLEQSTYYQFVAIDLFLQAKKLIKNLSGVDDPYINTSLKLMIDFSSHLIYPNNGAPSIGDSNFGYTNYVKTLSSYINESNIESEFFDYVISKGSAGQHLKKIIQSSKTGYVVIRPNNLSEWNQQSILFMDFGNTRHSHGHHDAMSFTFFSDNHELLIDSGGPYVYSEVGRKYFWSKLAHNTLIINNIETSLENAKLVKAECIELICYSIGQQPQNGNMHTRVIISLGDNKPNVYVFDHVKNQNLLNSYKLIYHFPPYAQIEQKNESTSVNVIYSPNKKIFIDVLSNSLLTSSIYYGYQDDKYKQGWVTPKYATEIPAPVVEFNTQNNNYWSLTSINQNGEPNDSVVQEVGDNFVIEINSKRFLIDFENTSEPTLSVY
jgi:hypothetical protein